MYSTPVNRTQYLTHPTEPSSYKDPLNLSQDLGRKIQTVFYVIQLGLLSSSPLCLWHFSGGNSLIPAEVDDFLDCVTFTIGAFAQSKKGKV